MKSSVILVFLIISSCLFASNGQLHFGIEFPGTHKWSENGNSLDIDSAAGLNLGGEVLSTPSQVVFGAGVNYFFPRTFKDSYTTELNFSFLAMHGICKFRMTPPESTTGLFLVGHLGYSLFFASDLYTQLDYEGELHANTEGGLYLAIGAEVALENHLVLGLMYRRLGGALTYSGASLDVTQTNMSVLLGYNF